MKTIFGFIFIVFSTVTFAATTYNCDFMTQADFKITNTSALVLPASSMRRCLIIQNRGTGGGSTIFIKFGSVHSGNEGMTLAASTIWMPIITPVDSVYIKNVFGETPVTVIEGK